MRSPTSGSPSGSEHREDVASQAKGAWEATTLEGGMAIRPSVPDEVRELSRAGLHEKSGEASG
jgi:hypothetical protein